MLFYTWMGGKEIDMGIKMRAPFVKVMEADDAEKERYAYELAMFLYGIYKNERKGDIMAVDKSKMDDDMQ